MAQSQGAIPTDPSLSLSLGRRRRGCNNPRAFARNRRETGSLETAPSATQSRGCSRYGIPPGAPRVFRGFQAISAIAGAAPVRRDASGAGWRPVSGRSSREPVSVVRVGSVVSLSRDIPCGYPPGTGSHRTIAPEGGDDGRHRSRRLGTASRCPAPQAFLDT